MGAAVCPRCGCPINTSDEFCMNCGCVIESSAFINDEFEGVKQESKIQEEVEESIASKRDLWLHK